MSVRTLLAEGRLVIALAVAVGGALAAVDAALAPRIAENARARLRDAALSVVPGGASIEERAADGVTFYRVAGADGRTAGWAAPGEGPGFQDTIRIIVGLDADAATVTGVVVLDARETPGLGDRVAEPAFTARFAGRAADAPVVVDAITGATISSKATVAIVNATVARARPVIGRQERAP